MKEIPNVVVVLARCIRKKEPFGIRFEEIEHGKWVADWAFPIKDEAARKEGYDRMEITGSFAYDQNYPGCSHCHAKAIIQCQCGKLACYDGESKLVTCPWCGVKGKISSEVTKMQAGIDR